MATAAPPRRESLDSLFNLGKRQLSSLDTLTAMGFPKSRAEKALAATGNKGVNLASNWLLSHVNDPDLDMCNSREYIIYMCPTGDFLEQLGKMWQESQEACGWNSAHIYHPHITLCSFFHMEDSKIDVLENVTSLMADIVKEWPALNYHIGLDLHTENNSFIGYFVTRDVHRLIEDMMVRVQREFIMNGVEMVPQKKQLHMTLAFQYNPEFQDRLMGMARGLSLSKDASWEIRIYSRQPVLRNYEVRRILKRYHPTQADELELSLDDCVYMDPEEHRKSQDGWFKGSSHLTGVSGFFPGIFTQKTSQMNIWTLHRSILLFPTTAPLVPLTSNTPLIPSSSNAPLVSPTTNHPPANVLNGEAGGAMAEPQDVLVYDNSNLIAQEDEYAVSSKQKKHIKPQSPPKPRRLYIVRHAQRCDFSYKGWFERSFDQKGTYKRFDLNCPASLPARELFQHFAKDGPLTEIGKCQARITGEGLKSVGETLTHVYSSCALRCVQTAQEIIKGIGASCKIRIEPGLFEWCGWCRYIVPTFMTAEELAAAGYNVDLSYLPLMKSTQHNIDENVGTYYTRSYKATEFIARKHKADGGNILLVGHSGSMDACTRQLRGKPAYTTEGQLRDVVRGIPYCFLCCVTEDPSIGQWVFCDPPVPILSHGMNKEYDWRSMLN